jgi:hypothetical protein
MGKIEDLIAKLPVQMQPAVKPFADRLKVLAVEESAAVIDHALSGNYLEAYKLMLDKMPVDDLALELDRLNTELQAESADVAIQTQAYKDFWNALIIMAFTAMA